MQQLGSIGREAESFHVEGAYPSYMNKYKALRTPFRIAVRPGNDKRNKSGEKGQKRPVHGKTLQTQARKPRLSRSYHFDPGLDPGPELLVSRNKIFARLTGSGRGYGPLVPGSGASSFSGGKVGRGSDHRLQQRQRRTALAYGRAYARLGCFRQSVTPAQPSRIGLSVLRASCTRRPESVSAGDVTAACRRSLSCGVSGLRRLESAQSGLVYGGAALVGCSTSKHAIPEELLLNISAHPSWRTMLRGVRTYVYNRQQTAEGCFAQSCPGHAACSDVERLDDKVARVRLGCEIAFEGARPRFPGRVDGSLQNCF
jgi:hypothetical protein